MDPSADRRMIPVTKAELISPADARPPAHESDRILTRGALAAICTLIAVGLAISLLSPLLSLTLSGRGVSTRTIGLLISTIAIAAMCASPFAARLSARIGAANAIILLLPVAAILIPFAWLIKSVWLLFPIVFVYGAAVSVAFVLSEYWINAATPDHRRGLVMGIYATCLSIGFAIGPAIISVVGTDSILPFLIGSGFFLLAIVPVTLARSISPDFPDQSKQSFGWFLIAVPVATFGVFCFALAESNGFAFLPLWGQSLGFAAYLAPLLASAMTLGNVALQIPLGLIADRTDKRRILFVCGLIGSLGMLVAYKVSFSPALLMATLFVWGGATAGLYTVGLAHLASRFRGADLANANAAFVFSYALGMLVGPVMVGETMTRAPTSGFPLVIGIVFAAYALVVLWRIMRAKA